MNSREQIASTFLKLNHEQFFDHDESLLRGIKSRLLDTELMGLAINSPKVIMTDAATELPVVMATCKTGLRGWEVRQKQNCVLFGIDKNSGFIRFGKVFEDVKAKISRGKPPPKEVRQKPDASSLPDIVAGAYRFDAKEVLDLPWESGKYALSLISYDWVSNTIEVELKSKEPKKPLVITAKKVGPAPSPGAGAKEKRFFGLLEQDVQVFPSYMRNSKTPPPPAGAGLSVRIEDPKKAEGRLLAYGIFVVNAKSHYLPEMRTSHQYTGGRVQNVAAVVPMTFVVVGLDWPVPKCFDWAIPVYSDKKIQPGQPIHGYFAIDVLSGTEVKLANGNYAAYIIMDGVVYGPAKFDWRTDNAAGSKTY
jgi:hypothetical protein